MSTSRRTPKRRKRTTESRLSSTGRVSARRFAVCINNDGYEASLERNKIYVVLPDEGGVRDGELRIIDESGEHYRFSAERFVVIDVPPAVEVSLLR